jgi:hypothetical protein
MALERRQGLQAAALLAAALLIGRSGGVSGLPAGAVLLLGAVCSLVLIALSVEPTLPRWVRRFAQLGVLAWLLAFCLALGPFVHTAGGVPTAVCWLGLFLLPLFSGLLNLVLVGLLWGACFSVVLAASLVWALALLHAPWTLDTVQAGLANSAWLGSVLAGLAGLLVPRLSAPPPAPTASPAFDLAQHLDSPGAQEGADKYTRE